MNIIIGLGNPGDTYAKTPHNAGYWAIDLLAQQAEASFSEKKKLDALIAQVHSGDKKYILAKPTTYMNSSGKAVQAIMNFYKADLSNLIVIHDEIDLPIGEYKIGIGRGHAGHNGIKSIFNSLNSKDFTRIRIGIKDIENTYIPTDEYVLRPLNSEQIEIINESIKKALTELALL